MFRFKYNSYHKIITGAILLSWAIYHFSDQEDINRHYENGQIKKMGGQLNGKNHGTWVWFHDNGLKKMEGTFKHGKRTGTWTTWSKTGNKLSEATYDNDKLNGMLVRWNDNGDMVSKRQYQNDIEIGNISLIK